MASAAIVGPSAAKAESNAAKVGSNAATVESSAAKVGSSAAKMGQEPRNLDHNITRNAIFMANKTNMTSSDIRLSWPT